MEVKSNLVAQTGAVSIIPQKAVEQVTHGGEVTSKVQEIKPAEAIKPVEAKTETNSAKEEKQKQTDTYGTNISTGQPNIDGAGGKLDISI